MKLLKILFFLLYTNSLYAQSRSDLGFENIDRFGNQVGMSYYGDSCYLTQRDSGEKVEGQYSLVIQSLMGCKDPAYKFCSFRVDNHYNAYNLTLKGYIKTKDVTGFAGIWLRLNGKDDILQFDNMQRRKLQGTTEWVEYAITLPYEKDKVTSIYFGGLISGTGKIWVDGLHLLADTTEIQKAILYQPILSKADVDSEFEHGSKILAIPSDKQTVGILYSLGIIWGVLKYHHHAIAAGHVNWDAELFRILPKILSTKGKGNSYAIIWDWVNSLPLGNPRNNFKPIKEKIIDSIDYEKLFQSAEMPFRLSNYLKRLIYSYPINSNYYVHLSPTIGNPIFENEHSYRDMATSDMGMRLLSLYRYWNMVRYYCPNVQLTDKSWNSVLKEYVPIFLCADTKEKYGVACLKLITELGDSHAEIQLLAGDLIDSIKGKYITPFQAKFIENRLVVTNFYDKAYVNNDSIHIGDIIESINGRFVSELVKEYLDVTPASNMPTKLRNMAGYYGFLLRSSKSTMNIMIVSSDKVRRGMTIQGLHWLTAQKTEIDGTSVSPDLNGFSMISESIGYIYPKNLDATSLGKITEAFRNTKGIILDLRCYPNLFMPYGYGRWLKKRSSDFVKFSTTNVSSPGTFYLTDSMANGGGDLLNTYEGVVVILVNEVTQSNAEFTVMALQTYKNAYVIGSTTAGADGNVSNIVLPGGIKTRISGIGVYYPDGTQTQRVGVRINMLMTPTIKGIRAGKDELKEAAVQYILAFEKKSE